MTITSDKRYNCNLVLVGPSPDEQLAQSDMWIGSEVPVIIIIIIIIIIIVIIIC